MLRKSVTARAIAPNEKTRRAGLYKPLTAASVVALALVMSPGEVSAQNATCGDPAQAPAFVPVGKATGNPSVACGSSAEAPALGSIAIGNDSNNDNVGTFAGSIDSTAVGSEAKIDSLNANGSVGATALGSYAKVGIDPGTGTKVDAARGIALGTDGVDTDGKFGKFGATVLANDGIAIGTDALVTKTAPGGIAVGLSAQSTAANSIALGNDITGDFLGATALGANAIAVGSEAQAQSDFAIAIGAGAESSSIAVGFGAKAQSAGVAIVGAPFKATKIGTAAAVGDLSQAIGDDTSAFGAFATVNGKSTNGSIGGTALGARASVGFDGTNTFDAPRAIAIGTDGTDAGTVGATALAADSVAIGTDALVAATAPGGIAIGKLSQAQNVSAIAIGEGAQASSIAIGKGAFANGVVGPLGKGPGTATAVGDFSTANGAETSAFGNRTQATALGAVALGSDLSGGGVGTTASGIGSTAVGSDAVAGAGAFATAVGANTSATFAGSAAFGADDTGVGAKATRDREQVFGTARNTYTMPGITSNESFLRQDPTTLQVVTSDADGHLATDGGFFRGAIDELREDAFKLREGIAVALATEDPDLVGNERFALKFNWGNFEGENALALTAALAFGRSVFVPGDRLTISGGAGWGLEHDTVGARVGLQLSWGGPPEFTTPGFPPLK